jgi:uncharacterized protein YqgC (DUF456 family)
MSIFAIALMALSLFLIPIGLPGLWIMVGIIALGTIYKVIGVVVLLSVLALAIGAELLEFFVLKRLTDRYGGSRKAYWGAIIGGVVGVMLGFPVPILGPVIAGFLGTFAGAVVVTLLEKRGTTAATRVGWGVLLGRGLAAAVKVAAGLVILVVGATAFLA